ncbi:MAG: hypothetical protein K2X60_03395 [Xanthobacteraceae bacterium]|nr:hypothetical protein [Xanthobacteraceae bacterium]
MGTIIEFPAGAATRRPGSSMDRAPRVSATVLILPAIRIERYAEEPTGERGPEKGTAPGRRRKRRARS